MATIEQGIDIRAPIDFVFTAITDPLRASDWNPNVLEVTDVSESPVREGTSWNQVTVMMGRPAKLTCRIASFRPPFEGLLEVGGQYAASVWTMCQEIPTGTHVTQRIEFTPPGGVFGKMAAMAIGPQLQREIAQTMSRQRDILEREVVGAERSGGE